MLQKILGVFRVRMPTPLTAEEVSARVEELMPLPLCEIEAVLGVSSGNDPRHDSKYYRIVTPEERAKRRKAAQRLLNSL